MSAFDAIDAFRNAIATAGLTPPDRIEADGELHRFASNGKRGDDAGWYTLHLDGMPAGAFGCWRAGVDEKWTHHNGREYTSAEKAEYWRRMEATKAARAADEARRREEAAQRARQIWDEAQKADPAHAYLQSKGVAPHGIRQNGDTLLIPIRVGVKLTSLQTITPDGSKRFLPGGEVRGGYFPIHGNIGDFSQPLLGMPLCVAEGFATAASVYEATGYPVAVAFNANNLEVVAQALRAKYPGAKLVICADDDYRTDGNPGTAKATAAARAVGGLLAVPDFGEDRPDGATDFNDLARHRGAEAVSAAVERAQAPDIVAYGQGAESGAWPDPEPLPDGLAPVKAFDFALLPTSLRPWATDIAERVQCAPDFVGVAIMAALAGAVGRRIAIRPQERTDWAVVPNLWALIVGRPGVMKSPAIEAALAPLKRLQAREAESYRTALADFEVTQRVAKLRGEEGEKAARAKLKENPRADVAHLLTGDPIDDPTMRRYLANDSTAAALGELLRQNPNGLLVHRDEMVSLLRALDREDSAEARGFYLTAWNGDSAFTFDRIGRGLNLHIPAVCLSLLGSTQPGRLAEYVRHAVRGGAGDDGLIQRFGLLVWPDQGGGWRDVDRWPDGEARRSAHAVFERLASLDPATLGTTQDNGPDGSPDGPPYLRFDADGLGLFREWRTDLEARLRDDDLHPAIESHLAKYRKLVPALALLIHLADGGTGPVGKRPTLQALAWAQYLETHARRAYGAVAMPEVAAARAILQRLRKGDLKSAFSSRDVWRPGWAGLADRDTVAAALALLCDLGWLRSTVNNDTGGRPATVYTAHPRALP